MRFPTKFHQISWRPSSGIMTRVNNIVIVTLLESGDSDKTIFAGSSNHGMLGAVFLPIFGVVIVLLLGQKAQSQDRPRIIIEGYTQWQMTNCR